MPATSTYNVKGVYVNTTDATVTTAATFTTRSNNGYLAIAKVVAIGTADYAEVSTHWREACFKNNAGTLTLVGASRTVATDNESTAGWDCSIDASGTDIRVRVTGAAATAITWKVDLEVHEVGKYVANAGVVTG